MDQENQNISQDEAEKALAEYQAKLDELNRKAFEVFKRHTAKLDERKIEEIKSKLPK